MRGPDVRYGRVTLLTSPEGGRYPSGNSLLIRGMDGAVLVERRTALLHLERLGRHGLVARTEGDYLAV
jgi:hypothetical protein